MEEMIAAPPTRAGTTPRHTGRECGDVHGQFPEKTTNKGSFVDSLYRHRIPSARKLQAEFNRLGTQAEVARAFGVYRTTVARWLRKHNLKLASRPEIRLGNIMKNRLTNETDKVRVAQWIMDEGSISLAYHTKLRTTCLIVIGSMNDDSVLSAVARILGATITSSKPPRPGILPMEAIRVQSAKAYALLEVVQKYLIGLKHMEADIVLGTFPRSGVFKGKRTTDEFFANIWEEFSCNTLKIWNSRRQKPITKHALKEMADIWLKRRVSRARRFSQHEILREKHGQRH